MLFKSLSVFLFVSSLFAQAATPFASTLPTVPPAIGQPGVSLAWDTTNKLLIVTFSVENSAGTTSTLTTLSYNPHTLEGISAGGVSISIGGVTVLLTHNLTTDPLKYQIGTATTILSICSIVTPTPTGQTTCPVVPF